MKNRVVSAVFLVLASVTIGGCLDLKKPPDARSNSNVPVLQTWARLAAEHAGAVRDNWVATFNDPALDAFVHEALANNTDLRLAAARRDQALAIARRAGAALWPAADLSAGSSAGGGRADNSSFIQATANWELDLWGRIRYLTSAARADARLAEADLEFARQSIAAQVAQTYYLTVANRLRLQNAQSQIVIQTEIDRIQQAKLKEGQAGRMDAELSKSDLAKFRADVQDRQATFEQSLRALEVLLGRFPAADVKPATTLPSLPAPVPAGLPADLLARRPDVMAAEHAVASAFFRKEAAWRNLLPRIALTADAGYASNELNGLLNTHKSAYSAGVALAQPLFDAGARFAQIESAKAVQRGALAAYAGVALNAFREVQNSLANEIYFRELSAQMQLSTASMDVALPLAQQRYNTGDLSLLNLKQVQTQAYQTKDAAISAHYSLIQQRIELHRALGGSILAPIPAATQPLSQPATPP